jgi:hypothetical protein
MDGTFWKVLARYQRLDISNTLWLSSDWSSDASIQWQVPCTLTLAWNPTWDKAAVGKLAFAFPASVAHLNPTPGQVGVNVAKVRLTQQASGRFTATWIIAPAKIGWGEVVEEEVLYYPSGTATYFRANVALPILPTDAYVPGTDLVNQPTNGQWSAQWGALPTVTCTLEPRYGSGYKDNMLASYFALYPWRPGMSGRAWTVASASQASAEQAAIGDPQRIKYVAQMSFYSLMTRVNGTVTRFYGPVVRKWKHDLAISSLATSQDDCPAPVPPGFGAWQMTPASGETCLCVTENYVGDSNDWTFGAKYTKKRFKAGSPDQAYHIGGTAGCQNGSAGTSITINPPDCPVDNQRECYTAQLGACPP